MTNKKRMLTVDQYIKTFSEDVQSILEKIRETIQKVVPGATETMSYGIPTFDLNNHHLVFFAGWKQYISLYPVPAGNETFQQKISQYKKEKSTLRFPIDKPIPYDLIGKIVILLVKEKQKKPLKDKVPYH